MTEIICNDCGYETGFSAAHYFEDGTCVNCDWNCIHGLGVTDGICDYCGSTVE